MGLGEGTGNVIAVTRNLLHVQQSRRGPNAFFRPRPDVVREDGAIEEAQERGWDIAARPGGRNHVGDHVYGNADDRRGHDDKRRSAASGENAVGGTAPTNEGRDKPFIYDQQRVAET